MKNIAIITILLILSTPIAFGQAAMEQVMEEDKQVEIIRERTISMAYIDGTSYKDKYSHLDNQQLFTQVRRDAQALRRALYDPWIDVDEKAAWRIFRETSARYRDMLRAEYNRITPRNHTLWAGIQRLGVATGDEVFRGKLLFKYGTLTALDRIVMSSNQNGTDEALIIRELMAMDHSPKAMERFHKEWEDKYAPGGLYGMHINGRYSTFRSWAHDEDGDENFDDSVDAFLIPNGTITPGAAGYIRDNLEYEPNQINRLLAQSFAQNKAPGARIGGENLATAIQRLFEGKLNELEGGMPSSPNIGTRELKCGPRGLGYRLCIPILGKTEVRDIGDYIVLIYRFALAISGILAFIMVTWGGIKWTVSGGNVSQISEAKDIIKNAIFGLILLALATTILYIIDPSILQIKIDRSTLTVERIKTPEGPEISVPSSIPPAE